MEWLTVRECSKILDVHPRTFRILMSRHDVPYIDVSAGLDPARREQIRIQRQDLENLIDKIKKTRKQVKTGNKLTLAK